MALYNLARVTTATTGTGTITLGAAVSGYLTFALAGVPDGTIVSYGIRDGEHSEVGRGTYTASGTTLSRDTILASTNGGSKIDLSGSAEVYITALAEDFTVTETDPVFAASPAGTITYPHIAYWDGKQDALGFTPLNPANNLSELSNKATARSNLELGSMAVVNDAPSNGATYGRRDGAWEQIVTTVAWGTITGTLSDQTDLQSALNAKQNALGYTPLNPANNLSDLASAATARTNLGLGAAALLAVPITAANGGTGIANGASATLTLPNAATVITGGGTLALGGFTLTVPASLTVAGLGIANVFTRGQFVDGTADEAQLRVQGHATQTANLQTWESNGAAVYSRISPAGVYQILDPDQPTGYAEFYHDHASNNPAFPRTFFYGYGGSSPPTNYVLYAASGDATGTTQIQASFGVSTNKDVKQASSYQLVLVQNTTRAVIASIQAEAIDGTPLYLSTRRHDGSDSGIIINNNTQQSVAIGTTSALISNTQLYVKNRLATNVGLAVEGHASQSANLLNVTSSTEILTSISSVGVMTVGARTTSTGAVLETLRLQSAVTTASTGGSTGFGVGASWYAETATNNTIQLQGAINTAWVVATNASRTARMLLYAYDTAAREFLRGEASGSAAMIGFLGAAAVVRPTAYTQTYSTTTRTFAAYTSDPESAAYTGAADGEAKLTDLNALRTAYETLRAHAEDTGKLVNQIIDDLQAYGLLA